MANYNNPFPDPFKDPSIKEATTNRVDITSRTQDYNPFSIQENDHLTSNTRNTAATATNQAPSLFSSLIGGGNSTGHQYNSAGNNNNNNDDSSRYTSSSELQKRQEELDRRAAELNQREQAMYKDPNAIGPVNNFPPLPNFCPLRPCFHQDIDSDIPLQFQKVVYWIFYFWIVYFGLLGWNLLICLSYFIVSIQFSLSNHSSVTFALSLLYFFILPPLAYVAWFRPAYKAFKNDSSVNFFLFFFVFFFQFCVCVTQALAVDGWGFAGIIDSLEQFTKGQTRVTALGAFMLLTGILFAGLAAANILLLIKVHQLYRSSGASFLKAQEEFSGNVRSSRTLQQAAGNIVASAANQTLLKNP